MKIEIDQSGKIEETSKNTILAFSNSNQDAAMISSSTKRLLQEEFRRQNKPKLFIYRVFTASLFLLLKPYLSSITTIVIYIEWTGKERLISDIFFEFIHKEKLKVKPQILFRLIGKDSPAHKLAWNTYKEIRDKKKFAVKVRKIRYKEISVLALKPQKNDRGLKID